MSLLSQKFKPAVPARTQLLLAAGMWTVVGSLMAFFGGEWVLLAWPGLGPWLVAVALVLGVAKSLLVLDRSAKKIAARIVERGDGTCIGGFLSKRSWAMVGVMSVSGRVLRAFFGTVGVIGLLYALIGAGLLISARLLWKQLWLSG